MSGEGPRRTVAVSLWAGQVRGAHGNSATVMRRVARPEGVASGAAGERALPIRALFEAAYPRFAAACRAVDEPGVAVVAIDEVTGVPAGLVRLIARVGRPVSAIVGRHDRCDLYLAGRDALSLRHLAIVLEPVTSWVRGASHVRYRLSDLRTAAPMVDETGRPLRGLVAEGPAIVACAGYVLCVLPLGDPTDWPATGAEAWDLLPERVYLDELHGAEGSVARLRLPPRDARQTFITRTGGPRDTGMRLAQGDIAGTLELRSPTRELLLQVGEDALRDGVLLGRYERCDATTAVADDEALSRVHALLLQQGERLLLVDTASSNGTFLGDERVRLAQVAHDTVLRLGKRTYVRWRWRS